MELVDQPVERARHEVIEDAPLEMIIDEAFVKRLETAVKLYQSRYLPACIALLNEGDIVNHGTQAAPKYSIQASGAEKIANPFGIVWARPMVVKHERVDEQGAFYEYEVEGIIECRTLRREGWFTGNCSSRDKFFNARGGFDEGDIRKSAFSNWLVNGITRLLGIRNPSRALLEKAGLKPDQIGVIDYSGNRSEGQSADVISEAQRKRLWAIFKGSGATEDQYKQGLKDGWKYESSNDIRRKDYDAVVAWVQAGCKPKTRTNGGGTAPAPTAVDKSKPCSVCKKSYDEHANADHEFEV